MVSEVKIPVSKTYRVYVLILDSFLWQQLFFPQFFSTVFRVFSNLKISQHSTYRGKNDYTQLFEYDAIGILTLQMFSFILYLVIAIIFIFSTICQMYYIFC